MQAGNLLLLPLWEAAPLESGWGDVPAAGFQYKSHETGFHTNFGFLLPGDRDAAEFRIKSIIESFGLVEELLIGQERCLWPNISKK